MRSGVLILVFSVVFSGRGAAEDDLSYITDDELKAEIAAREGDMSRTRRRVEELAVRQQAVIAEAVDARTAVRTIEQQAAARVRAYYRMSRNAGTLRFLLDAASPTDAVRRVTTLRRLLIDALETRRAAGLRLAAAERTLTRIEEERDAAEQMLALLNETHRMRLAEAERRKLRLPSRP